MYFKVVQMWSILSSIMLFNHVTAWSAISLSENADNSKEIDVQDLHGSDNIPCADACLSTILPEQTELLDICAKGCLDFSAKFRENKDIEDTYYNCAVACDVYQDIQQAMCELGCYERYTQIKKETQSVIAYSVQDGHNLLYINPAYHQEEFADKGFVKSQVKFNDFDVNYKIPETNIKTLPIQEFANIIQRKDEVKLRNIAPTGDWLDCASRNSGIPKSVLLLAILGAIIIAFCLSFSSERKVTPDVSDLSDDEMLNPDEALTVTPSIQEEKCEVEDEDLKAEKNFSDTVLIIETQVEMS